MTLYNPPPPASLPHSGCLTISVSISFSFCWCGCKACQCALVWRAEEFALLGPLRQEQIKVSYQSECAFQAAAEESKESGTAATTAAPAGAIGGSCLCKCWWTYPNERDRRRCFNGQRAGKPKKSKSKAKRTRNRNWNWNRLHLRVPSTPPIHHHQQQQQQPITATTTTDYR